MRQSLPSAIYSMLHGSFGLEHQYFPQVDLMIMLDILSSLQRSGRLNPKQLRTALNQCLNRDTLRRYLRILIELGLVSEHLETYRGIARMKKFYEITKKGSEFVTVTGRMLSR